MSGLSKLRKLKKTNNNFEQNKELVEKMKKGLRIKLVNNLSSGIACYTCAISRMDYTLDTYQQSLVLGFDEFNYLINNKKNILRNFALMPVGCEVDDYNLKEDDDLLKEVLKTFGLAKLYDIEEDNTGGDYLYEGAIDDIILEFKYDDFVDIVEEIPLPLYEKVVMRAIDLCRTGKLNDMQKIKYLIDSTDNADLFINEDITNSSKIRKIR